MILDIKVPSPGESINEVEVSNWLINDGDYVEKDQEIVLHTYKSDSEFVESTLSMSRAISCLNVKPHMFSRKLSCRVENLWF